MPRHADMRLGWRLGMAGIPRFRRTVVSGPFGGMVLLGVLWGALATGGCSRQPKKDVFIEHWNAKARGAEGYSPAARPRRVEFERTTVTPKPAEVPLERPARALPRQRVTLRMYDTDLVSVVRAMARAAGANVVLSSSIPGAGADDKPLRINVNVTRAPWDETFKSILAANGLAYAVEGDIIRVMTLDDMERQNKLREVQNKACREADKARELAPYETCKVEINYADLDELAVTLNALCGNTVGIPGLGERTATEKTTAKGSRANINDPSLETSISLSDPAKAAPLGLPVAGRDRPGLLKGYVIPDHNSNSLVIQASREDARKLIALIEKLDQPRPQIKLKAFIVQTDRKTAQQLGIQWGGLLKGSNLRITPGQMGSTDTSGTATTTPIFPGGVTPNGFGINNPAGLSTSETGLGAAGTAVNFLIGKIGENALEAQLTALAEENKAKILSSPTITTLENKEAFTESGKKIPFVSTSQNGTNVQFADALLRLEILPHIVDGTNLRLRIVVKDDQVDETQANWVQGNPPIYKRETRSTLVVEDGDTVVISGLTRETMADGESGVPFLRSIPGLGWAFKSKSASIKREEILIFITPVILKEKPIAPAPSVAGRDIPSPAADAGARP